MSKNDWTHSICRTCYGSKYPGRRPVRVLDDDPQPCCYCGTTTEDGIYVRDDPKKIHPSDHA